MELYNFIYKSRKLSAGQAYDIMLFKNTLVDNTRNNLTLLRLFNNSKVRITPLHEYRNGAPVIIDNSANKYYGTI